jgi:D-alanyl-D-alanine carboxypeptidase
MKTGFICASGYNVVASATRNGRRLIAIVLGAYSGAVRAQKAAALLERGFNGNGLSWLTPSLGTVDALVPIDAQPPNLRDEMCGGHRRKPPAEDNDEEQSDSGAVASGDREAGSARGFLLSALGPANGKFVLGPPVETEPPVKVFTGPADHPDAVQTAEPRAKKKKHVAKKSSGEKTPAAAKTDAAKPGAGTKTAVAPKRAKHTAKPKVSSAN